MKRKRRIWSQARCRGRRWPGGGARGLKNAHPPQGRGLRAARMRPKGGGGRRPGRRARRWPRRHGSADGGRRGRAWSTWSAARGSSGEHWCGRLCGGTCPGPWQLPCWRGPSSRNSHRCPRAISATNATSSTCDCAPGFSCPRRSYRCRLAQTAGGWLP